MVQVIFGFKVVKLGGKVMSCWFFKAMVVTVSVVCLAATTQAQSHSFHRNGLDCVTTFHNDTPPRTRKSGSCEETITVVQTKTICREPESRAVKLVNQLTATVVNCYDVDTDMACGHYDIQGLGGYLSEGTSITSVVTPANGKSIIDLRESGFYIGASGGYARVPPTTPILSCF